MAMKPSYTTSWDTIQPITASRHRALPKALQALLNDPNLLFIRPIPATTKMVAR
ncbi:hypothetical protein [Agrobacterium vaccinii]|uniref:hypothetical protein n=1 Tax=Agrobacterium vaccinii TaxID=2735528 RepID=UPI003D689C10